MLCKTAIYCQARAGHFLHETNLQHIEMMNLSEQYSSIRSENDCRNMFFKSVSLRYPSTSLFYGLLVAAAVLELFVCPFTILFNALVMIAVKTKRRLQTHPNVLLACLALTDLMVGLVVQPLHVTKIFSFYKEKIFTNFVTLIWHLLSASPFSVMHRCLTWF